ncbi:MAG: hypothetical protein ALECFALPRED_002780 [Alectoria fallacina]|uniref:Glutaredoxin-like protein n=1 Tax=Alectoria fallacina TaxID=1903189 RepID=A0A8H3FJD9_9LECA|nr:MAG: hypothetical protein ALECFALPRED_002780 [Alectoria fallacina]
MRATPRLLQPKTLLILFTRENCSLCHKASSVILEVSKKRSFDYHQVDVMASDQQQWKLLYEFDTPVVRISFALFLGAAKSRPKLHVQRNTHKNTEIKEGGKIRKLMHRFDERQVEELIDETEAHS